MKKFKIAIVGATGAVGREMLRCVFQFNFPFESIKLLASARSAGKEIEFEGHKFYGTKDYDKFLRYVYNDYMKLPPKDKRQPHALVSSFNFNVVSNRASNKN